MVEKLWISGVIVAFLSFGIKAGLGIGSKMFNPAVTRMQAALFFITSLVTYMALFAGLYLVVTRLNLIAYLDRLSHLLQYGMSVHIAVALGLGVWGIKLLLKPENIQQSGSKAGLLLMLPCPVCAAVILLNLTLALSLSKMSPLATTLFLFALFWTIILLTLLALAAIRGRAGVNNGFLGASMVLIAIYFLATVLIAPIYPKIKPAFAMAASNNPISRMDPHSTVILCVCCLILTGVGFARFQLRKGEVS
ncbi:DUF2162 family putative transporter [Desulfogranum japonicum]|uniref:DUF2162 family putative transporter n=1 Tax=Desulfogranum japonicum TaxID=231447 RepID=UPI0003F61CA8|nr:DUF2162 family putative transporter [Desulfogranum japonicum]